MATDRESSSVTVLWSPKMIKSDNDGGNLANTIWWQHIYRRCVVVFGDAVQELDISNKHLERDRRRICTKYPPEVTKETINWNLFPLSSMETSSPTPSTKILPFFKSCSGFTSAERIQSSTCMTYLVYSYDELLRFK